jgi:hypothetical protein
VITDYCLFADGCHVLESPEEVIKPEREWTGQGDVGGYGLLFVLNDKLGIFFTFHFKLIGR